MSPRRVWTAVVLALLLAPIACRKTAADCPSPPVSGCPEAGARSFADVYMNVIYPACVRCHSSSGQESNRPLTTYQQVYGEASEIRNQVFYQCLMPPSDAPEMLAEDQRQMLWDWIACGAPVAPGPATDGGAGD